MAGRSHNGRVTTYAATITSAADGTRSSRSERVMRVRAAGFPRRLMAALVDALVVLLVASAVTAAAALALGLPLPTVKQLGPDLLVAGILDRNPMAVGAAGLFVGVGALYQIYLGGILGQTIGKRLFGLRVISWRGGSPGPGGGILRFVALVLSILPAGLGWLWCLFDREHRALHDHLAGSYVIVEDR